MAESVWCRGGGDASRIRSVEYHYHPILEARWHAKKREYDRRFGVGGHTVLFAFHGTPRRNVESILRDGFKLSMVGTTTDAGDFGAGLYFSERLQVDRLLCDLHSVAALRGLRFLRLPCPPVSSVPARR